MKKNYIKTECERCGYEWEITKGNLKKKRTKLCTKCVCEDKRKWNTPEKKDLAYVYSAMIQRCTNPNNQRYEFYGAKGVSVCEEWTENKMAFVEWCLSNGYVKGLQIDKDILSRKLNIEPPIYSPETCMFVTAKGNTDVKTSSRMLTFRGKTQNMSLWAREVGIEFKTLQARLDKFGFTVEEALIKPTGKRYGAGGLKSILQLDLQDNLICEYKSAREADKETGISYKNISSVLREKSKTAGGYKWKFKI